MFVVLFEVQPKAEQFNQYLDFAKLLRPELEKINGFLDNERFTHTEQRGRIISLSTWRDEKALIRWRTHAEHHDVQEQGRTVVFHGYTLRVGEVTADTLPPDGVSLHQQRFDETEAVTAKAATITEVTVAPPLDALSAHPCIAALTPPPEAHGVLKVDHFTSIVQPTKRLILAAWRAQTDALAWLEAVKTCAADGCVVRHRAVRVIRTYGMADRDESPQYYPSLLTTE